MDYQDINAATIDRWIEEGWETKRNINNDMPESDKIEGRQDMHPAQRHCS
jgi:hypothetical protein